MEVKETGLGLATIKGPRFDITLEVQQKAAMRVHLEHKQDIGLWMQENIQSRVGMTIIIHLLQKDTNHSFDEIWDNWFEDYDDVSNEVFTTSMLRAFSIVLASKAQLAEMQAIEAEAKKKAEPAVAT